MAGPRFLVNDEAHLITIHPLFAPYTAKALRLLRKYGAWDWAITHSLEDFPESARRMLNMMEWWRAGREVPGAQPRPARDAPLRPPRWFPVRGSI